MRLPYVAQDKNFYTLKTVGSAVRIVFERTPNWSCSSYQATSGSTLSHIYVCNPY